MNLICIIVETIDTVASSIAENIAVEAFAIKFDAF